MLKRYDGEPVAVAQAFSEARRTHGPYGNARGEHHEKRLLAVIAVHFRAKWYVSARRATKSEDQNGIDVVVETTIGPLYLQVKSSLGGARSFARRRRRARITVVIVNERLTDADILKVVQRKLNSLFHHILNVRRGRRRRHKHISTSAQS